MLPLWGWCGWCSVASGHTLGTVDDALREQLLDLREAFLHQLAHRYEAGLQPVVRNGEDRRLRFVQDQMLDVLAGHSLVNVDVTDAGPRFRMLASVQEFAAERLAASANLAHVEQRHADYFGALVENADWPAERQAEHELMRQDIERLGERHERGLAGLDQLVLYERVP